MKNYKYNSFNDVIDVTMLPLKIKGKKNQQNIANLTYTIKNFVEELMSNNGTRENLIPLESKEIAKHIVPDFSHELLLQIAKILPYATMITENNFKNGFPERLRDEWEPIYEMLLDASFLTMDIDDWTRQLHSLPKDIIDKIESASSVYEESTRTYLKQYDWTSDSEEKVRIFKAKYKIDDSKVFDKEKPFEWIESDNEILSIIKNVSLGDGASYQNYMNHVKISEFNYCFAKEIAERGLAPALTAINYEALESGLKENLSNYSYYNNSWEQIKAFIIVMDEHNRKWASENYKDFINHLNIVVDCVKNRNLKPETLETLKDALVMFHNNQDENLLKKVGEFFDEKEKYIEHLMQAGRKKNPFSSFNESEVKLWISKLSELYPSSIGVKNLVAKVGENEKKEELILKEKLSVVIEANCKGIVNYQNKLFKNDLHIADLAGLINKNWNLWIQSEDMKNVVEFEIKASKESIKFIVYEHPDKPMEIEELKAWGKKVVMKVLDRDLKEKMTKEEALIILNELLMIEQVNNFLTEKAKVRKF